MRFLHIDLYKNDEKSTDIHLFDSKIYLETPGYKWHHRTINAYTAIRYIKYLMQVFIFLWKM